MMSLRLQKELKVTTPIAPGKSPGARLVQEYLNLNGIKLNVDGDWGPATSRGLATFAPGANQVDQALMERLAAKLIRMITPRPVGLDLAGTIVATAHQHLDTHPVEIGGENSGPYVREYMDGMQGKQAPWCAGAATYIVRQACEALGILVPGHLQRTYSCDTLAERARLAGKLVQGRDPRAAAGGIFLVRGARANDWIHTGIIIDADPDAFATIEGNTNDEGSREGFEVCQRIRARKALDVILL